MRRLCSSVPDGGGEQLPKPCDRNAYSLRQWPGGDCGAGGVPATEAVGAISTPVGEEEQTDLRFGLIESLRATVFRDVCRVDAQARRQRRWQDARHAAPLV